tara:strand:+ start:776 stop:946 length:171 start_codon:yes stop_codon:yes gene_type:complete
VLKQTLKKFWRRSSLLTTQFTKESAPTDTNSPVAATGLWGCDTLQTAQKPLAATSI